MITQDGTGGRRQGIPIPDWGICPMVGRDGGGYHARVWDGNPTFPEEVVIRHDDGGQVSGPIGVPLPPREDLPLQRGPNDRVGPRPVGPEAIGLRDGLLHRIFEVQAEARPQAIAVRWGNQTTAYARLEAKANLLAL